jgi:EAL domain-containing protein (putative c-di-GMP-specific phosphodiesterase class I)
MNTDRSDAAIVRAVVDLGRDLGLQVVAEGVEIEATSAALTELGCHAAQGYYLTRPLPAADLASWLPVVAEVAAIS